MQTTLVPPTWRTRDTLILFQSNDVSYRERYAEKARAEYNKDLAALVLADKPDLSKDVLTCMIFSSRFNLSRSRLCWMDVNSREHLSRPACQGQRFNHQFASCIAGMLPPFRQSSLRINVVRTNSTGLKPSSEHTKRGWRVELRRLES